MKVARKWHPELISAAVLLVTLLVVALIPAGAWKDRAGYVAYGALAMLAYFLANRFVFDRKLRRKV